MCFVRALSFASRRSAHAHKAPTQSGRSGQDDDDGAAKVRRRAHNHLRAGALVLARPSLFSLRAAHARTHSDSGFALVRAGNGAQIFNEISLSHSLTQLQNLLACISLARLALSLLPLIERSQRPSENSIIARNGALSACNTSASLPVRPVQVRMQTATGTHRLRLRSQCLT